MIKVLCVALALASVASPAFAFSWSVYQDRTIQAYVKGLAGKATASRSCLSGDTRAVLSRLEARFGAVKVISTCRPGAVIAGTGRPSQHRYGKAVDFMPNGNRSAVLAWLRSNVNGAVITYASGHIHFDTGGYRYRGRKRS